MKTRSLVLCFFVFPLIFSACAPEPTPDIEATITAQAMTLDAVNFLATIPSETPVPPACAQAAIMVEETIPDGSVMLPGTPFLKTWTFRNAGNCAWTTDTIFEFYAGNRMEAAAAIHLPQEVQPGQTVVIAVNMVAPQEPGTYRGDWIFREPGGTIFGWGEQGDQAVWVLIRVGSEAGMATPAISSSCAPTVSVSMDTNCRQGPGIPYDSVGSLLVGETATIVGRYQAGGYWIINNPDEPGTCWVWDEHATVTGETSCLPFIIPPPKPPEEPTYNPYLMCTPPRALIGSGVAVIAGYGFDPSSDPTFTFEFYRQEDDFHYVSYSQNHFPVDSTGYVNLTTVNCLNPLHITYTMTAFVNGVEVSSCTVTCVDP
jgi:hypothetical protein